MNSDHHWQAITQRANAAIFWCDGCGSLKDVSGGQTAFCSVRGKWSYRDPPCAPPQGSIAQDCATGKRESAKTVVLPDETKERP